MVLPIFHLFLSWITERQMASQQAAAELWSGHEGPVQQRGGEGRNGEINQTTGEMFARYP